MDDVLLNKAAIIERCLKRIAEEYTGHEHELATNFTRQDAIVLNLQRACEAAIMVGFRNLAVHAYQEINPSILQAILQHRLDDFRAFARRLIELSA